MPVLPVNRTVESNTLPLSPDRAWSPLFSGGRAFFSWLLTTFFIVLASLFFRAVQICPYLCPVITEQSSGHRSGIIE